MLHVAALNNVKAVSTPSPDNHGRRTVTTAADAAVGDRRFSL